MEIDFQFLKTINKELYDSLEIARKDIGKIPRKYMESLRNSLIVMINDVIKKEKLDLIQKNNKKKTKYTLIEKIEVLKSEKILDLKNKAICDTLIKSYNEYGKTNKVDEEWEQLCLTYMYMLCKWYAKKYYKIEGKPQLTRTNNEVFTRKETKNTSKNTIKNKSSQQLYNIKIDTSKISDHVNEKEAKKAYENLNLHINDKIDALLFLSSVNLLNAYVKQEDAVIYMKPKYVFKGILVNKLEEIIKKNIDGISIYINHDTTYVKIFNLQFSFKFLPPNSFMDKYKVSDKNKIQQWEGIRLQPCAESIFLQSEQVYNLKNKKAGIVN